MSSATKNTFIGTMFPAKMKSSGNQIQDIIKSVLVRELLIKSENRDKTC
jgi:hypothetical protein